MLLRKIVKIDEEKCNGCGQCINACAEGAIALVNGKAKLVSETYCDGLGACLGTCPQDAITIESRAAEEFSEEEVAKHLQKTAKTQHTPVASPQSGGFVCPGTMTKKLRDQKATETDTSLAAVESQLTHWPIQLKLISPNAPYLKNADLLLAGDCVPFAMGNFHSTLLKGRCVLVGCPKLDDSQFYIEKFAQILKANNPRSLTVVHMEVPCCFGLKQIAEEAMKLSGVHIAIKDVTISLTGEILG
ncbi:MAG: 4Fe-4S binding protein [Sedimentisphaerales bacterium]|nr:4Fe-4S binding protein [Sedimentisphaerales bacterium]